jgi:hypothetical protein
MDDSGVGLFLLILIIIYFAPTIIAFIRQKENAVSILMLNLFLGWTFVGWVIALVWSFMVEEEKRIM